MKINKSESTGPSKYTFVEIVLIWHFESTMSQIRPVTLGSAGFVANNIRNIGGTGNMAMFRVILGQFTYLQC